MDQSKFQEAQAAYDGGDYRTAAKLFLAAAGRGAAGNGAAYGMAGNALMRLRRHQDAVTVYGHALKDETYEKRGAVQANLGAAYSALGDYAEAVKSYEAALGEPDYQTSYKAWQGMARAHAERGRFEEAAVAYRKAAIDPSNPEPGKALVNLGLSFMGLGRPGDAVDAYTAALGFDDYKGRGKALSNLGQAYVAMGEYDEAVRAFEKATQLHGHRLSSAAQRAYDTAVAEASSSRETVEGWETGEIPPVLGSMPPAGWDTGELVALTGTGSSTLQAVDPPGSDGDVPVDAAAHAAASLGMGDDHAVTSFFSKTEEEMRTQDREARRAQRVSRRSGSVAVKTIVIWSVVVLVFVAGAAAAYWSGFGWPMQKTTVTGLISAYAEGQPIDRYWVAVPDKDIAREMAKIPPVKDFEVIDVAAGPRTAVVKLAVTPEKGAPLRYSVTLSREGVGWRVTGIENDWRSSGG